MYKRQDVARALRLPFISGNVSFYNESSAGAIPPTPQITGIGIVPDIRKCVTSDLKERGNYIYLVGETKREMGGSEYYGVMGLKGGKVPEVDVELLKRSMDALLELIWNGYVRSCHDLSEGGLAVAVAESSIGGDIGVEIDIDGVADLREDFVLFSESNTRWIIETGEKDKVEEILSARNVPFRLMGKTGGREIRFLKGGEELFSVDVDTARKIWRDGISKFMG